MNRFKIAQVIALGAAAFSVIGGLLGGLSGSKAGITLISIGFIAGLVAYIFAGLFTAIKMAGGIAKWGWFLAPFPYDIATFSIAFLFSIIAFTCLPIIPVRRAYRQYGCYMVLSGL